MVVYDAGGGESTTEGREAMADYELNGVSLTVPDAILTPRIAAKLAGGGYERQEVHAVQMRLKAGQRVLDLGAGLGYVAALAARIAGAENVTALEANPDLLPVIRANLERNGAGAAQLVHGAVAGAGGAGQVIAFERKPAFWASRLAVPGADTGDVVEVPVFPIAGLLAAHRPHVVIMDVEGAEAQLFERPWPRHVKAVMMELHPGRYPDSTVKQIVDCMSVSGLTYDPGPSCGRILCFRRVRAAE